MSGRARKPTRARGLGVTEDEYQRMLASQGGGCAICGNPPKTRRLHVDHDHLTGAVRGLLCFRCNRVLASYISVPWLVHALAYLRAHESLLDKTGGSGVSSPVVDTPALEPVAADDE